MKTKLLIILASLFFAVSHAQVGINNTAPQSSLDITATDVANPSNTDGILIPRVDNFPATDPGASQDGMMVFATGNGTPTKGFYYWDNTSSSWLAMAGSSDIDWYVANSTVAPSSITDNMVTQGNVTIGNSNVGGSAKLNVDSNDATLNGIQVTNSGSAAGSKTGIEVTNAGVTGTSSQRYYGVETILSSPDPMTQTGYRASFNNMSSGSFYHGVFVNYPPGGSLGIQRGISNYMGGGETGQGVYNIFPGAFTYSGLTYGVYNALQSNGNGRKYGVYNTISGSGSGQKYGTYTNINASSGGIHYGVLLDVQKPNSYAAYFIGRTSFGTDPISNRYLMPAADGTAGQVIGTDGAGNLSFVNAAADTDDQTLSISGHDLTIADGNTVTLPDNDTTYSGADFALSNQTLAPGEVVIGIAADGTLISTTISDTDDQNLTLSGTTLSIEDGNSVNLSSIQDGTGTDDQNLTLSGTTLSIEDGNSINLASIDTDTDDQTIDTFSFNTGTGVLTLEIEDDGVAAQTVNLSSLQDGTGTDDQNLTLTGNTLSIEDGNSVNLSSIDTDTDDQTLSLSGNTLSIVDGNSVNLSSINTDNQTIDTFNFNSGTGVLTLEIEDDGVAAQTVNLSSLQDGTGTDDQNLNLSGTTLSIENGNSINLASIDTDTDDQTLSLSGNTLSIADGNSVNLASLNTDDQTILLTGTTLSIEDGNSVNLASLDTDDQTIDTFSFNAGTGDLTLEIEADGVAPQTVNLSALDSDDTTASNGLTESGNDIRLGGTLTQTTTLTQNNFNLNMNSTGTGRVNINQSGSADRGLNITKTDNSGNRTYGMYIDKTGSGSGNAYAIYNLVNGSGTGQKYGTFNDINSSANGSQYGTRNWLHGNGSAQMIATLNNLDNGSSGNQYGVYNGMRSTASSQQRGVHNEFNTAVNATELTGVRNQISNGTASGGIQGFYNYFSNNANSTMYGIRTEFDNGTSGSGNKYGTYNLISSGAGGTHYGTYNNVSTSNGWAGYFVGRNYISGRLSVGEENNAAAKVNVSTNSSGGSFVHLELEETGSNDGSRLTFTNALETASNWTIYGRADDTAADARLNFFRTGTGNIMQVFGDGQVQVNGQFSVNLANPTYAIQLPNSATIGTGRGRANAWTTYSDGRLKSDQKIISSGLATIMKIQPKSYFHHNSTFENNALIISDEGETTVGFIAQELFEVLPEAVQKPADENSALWSVDYNKVVPVAVKAIQELDEKVEALTEENKRLKQQLSQYEALEARLSALEAKDSPETSSADLLAEN
ncbi:tail fiber domain-containing protein [Luteirhabdus pelagi]|uniref:tail fiber domain-containing protein n=1 Tax=Luteirhabdus pelagi TaxID=2792783 RepID=UPI001939D9AE|nr:tail fiber domain-containing protein [Luteirhabdus pelagi]